MTKIFVFFLILTCSFFSVNSHAESFNINKVSSLKESEIDIAELSLQLAKEYYPGLDVKKYQNQLNAMVSEIKLKTRGITDPDFRIRVINTYLYKEVGFQYDLDDPQVMNANNRYLNGLLDTKKGSCITLPLLYVVLGQKLGYPIYPVLVPQHFFVRYTDPKFLEQNIEATGGGGYVPDSRYKRDFSITETGIKSGAYLKSLSYKEYLSELIAINSIFLFKDKKDFKKSFKYIDTAIKIRPITPDFYRYKGMFSYILFMKYAKEGNVSLATFYNAQAEKLSDKSYKLGFVKLSTKEYLASVEAKKLALKNKGF